MEDCGSLSSRVCKCALASSIVTARASRSVRSAAHSWRACSSAFGISSHLARICLSCCVKSLCVCRYWPLRSINRPIFCASASNSFSMDSFLDKKLHFNGYRMCLASKCCKSALVTTSEFMRFAHGSDAGNGSIPYNSKSASLAHQVERMICNQNYNLLDLCNLQRFPQTFCLHVIARASRRTHRSDQAVFMQGSRL